MINYLFWQPPVQSARIFWCWASWKDELFVSGGTRWDGEILEQNNQITKLTHEKTWDKVASLSPFRRDHLFEIIPHHEEDGLLICGGYTLKQDKWDFVKTCQTLKNENLASAGKPKFHPAKTNKESSIRAQHLWATTYLKHYRTIIFLRRAFKSKLTRWRRWVARIILKAKL